MRLRLDRKAREEIQHASICLFGSTIRSRFQTFDKAFEAIEHTVCYSVKANSNLSILKMLAQLGSGFDIVSGGELERVVRVDKKAASRVVFSGVGKNADEMDLALQAGILMFDGESEGEAELLASRAAKLKKRGQVAMRVNPDVFAETHPYISTGLHKHKFGVPIEAARKIYREMAKTKYLDVAGISVHIGSQITSVDPLNAAMDRVAELAQILAQRRTRYSLHRLRRRTRYPLSRRFSIRLPASRRQIRRSGYSSAVATWHSSSPRTWAHHHWPLWRTHYARALPQAERQQALSRGGWRHE